MRNWHLRGVLGPPLTRRQLLTVSAAFAGAAFLPSCRVRELPDAGPVDSGPEPARPPVPLDLVRASPIAKVEAPASGFQGDDFTRPHEILWKLESLGQIPAPRERAELVVVGGGMSGLSAAWRLRQHKPIVLEQSDRFGGNSKGETWNGITYSIGAAYLAKPDPADRLSTEFYGPLGVDKAWRVSAEDPVVRGGKQHLGFWRGTTDPKRKSEFLRTKKYLDQVLHKAYPDIPFESGGDLDETQLAALDKVSLRQHLLEKVGQTKKGRAPELHPHIEIILDHYGWSTFGGGIDELSAAAFLCAYVAEFDGICALPGGNSAIAHRLLEELARSVETTRLRASSLVVRVKTEGEDVHVTVQDADGRLYTIAARTVVMACPKFVAKKLMPDLPPEQRTAIERIRYRAYVVANLLLRTPCPAPALDLYLLGDDAPTLDTMAASTRQRATDVVMGHWAQGGHPSASVLTLYRPYPYDGGRPLLFVPEAFDSAKKEIQGQALEILPLLGLKESAISEVRLSRFGHALNLSEKGLIADGTWARARETVSDRIFFLEQDNWPAPAIETCFTNALLAESAIKKSLGAG
ncbi:MAG: FAD-dependent oxidoreductase [Deltaproteobacteria bacterium]|nr:FAD-dependent oxidoreductase [Deltaproteobacteria bacterium]